MRISRIYIDQPLENGHTIEISNDKAHYLKQVLRLSVDNKVILFNGQGGEFSGVISDVKKHIVSVDLQSFSPIDKASKLKITLGLGIIKRESMDLAIQKATELGVTDICPLVTENTSVPHKTLSKRLDHWQQVAYSACEQSGLNRPPLIQPPSSLPQWLNDIAKLDQQVLKLIADLGPSQSILDLEQQPASLVLAIGPEGGFTSDESSQIQGVGFQNITLGPRVLRAETAVITMMSLAQARWGDI